MSSQQHTRERIVFGILLVILMLAFAGVILNIVVVVNQGKVSANGGGTADDGKHHWKPDQGPYTVENSQGYKLIFGILLGILLSILVLALLGVILDIVVLIEQGKHCPNGGHGGNNKAHWMPDPGPYNVENSKGFKDAANLLLTGIDVTVDPCEDFYQFTCNGFKEKNPLKPGQNRIAAYDQPQAYVNDLIRVGIEAVQKAPADDKSVSKTERYLAKAYTLCMEAMGKGSLPDESKFLKDTIISQLGGFPAIETTTIPGWATFWEVVGNWEAKYMVPSLMSSYVTVDYEHAERHALYLNQAFLMMPRDYYVKPQFLKQSEMYLEMLKALVKQFNKNVEGKATDEQIDNAVTEVVQFEVQLALASVPDDLLRNYRQQYNEYDLKGLQTAYHLIEWSSYFKGLGLDKNTVSSGHFVVVQPAFFDMVDVIRQGWSRETLVNFLVIRLLLSNVDFLGTPKLRETLFGELPVKTYAESRTQGHGIGRGRMPMAPMEYDSSSQSCVDLLTGLMPYGTGYIYVKRVENRDAVQKNIETQTNLVIEAFIRMVEVLDWMTDDAKNEAKKKSEGLVKNYGWPNLFDFNDFSVLDAYHDNYKIILDKTDLLEALMAFQEASQATENLGLLSQKPDRANFLQSPATVNAWYQPERNSITFPLAILNPPYYRLDFPQAFNYAGQGGTAGHELSHGFDDEGVQFGAVGELSNCTWSRCGWMDRESTFGFLEMAQCVVSQYSTKCCPVKTGSVNCVNGATTQGENIADLAGQQAAFSAYRKYVETKLNGVEEKRLPGMEQFTPDQIFWITYGFSWCENRQQDAQIRQLLLDPHAPGSCRVNQVVQDIPEFGRVFNCPIGSPMYPIPQQKCKVWT